MVKFGAVGASIAALYLPSRDDPNRLTTTAPSRPFPTAVLCHSLTLLSAPLSCPLLLYPQRTSVALLSANLRRSPALVCPPILSSVSLPRCAAGEEPQLGSPDSSLPLRRSLRNVSPARSHSNPACRPPAGRPASPSPPDTPASLARSPC